MLLADLFFSFERKKHLFEMSSSILAIVLIAAVIIVGIVLCLCLTRQKNQRIALLVAFGVLLVIAIAFFIVVVYCSQLYLNVAFAALALLLPVCAYFLTLGQSRIRKAVRAEQEALEKARIAELVLPSQIGEEQVEKEKEIEAPFELAVDREPWEANEDDTQSNQVDSDASALSSNPPFSFQQISPALSGSIASSNRFSDYASHDSMLDGGFTDAVDGEASDANYQNQSNFGGTFTPESVDSMWEPKTPDPYAQVIYNQTMGIPVAQTLVAEPSNANESDSSQQASDGAASQSEGSKASAVAESAPAPACPSDSARLVVVDDGSSKDKPFGEVGTFEDMTAGEFEPDDAPISIHSSTSAKTLDAKLAGFSPARPIDPSSTFAFEPEVVFGLKDDGDKVDGDKVQGVSEDQANLADDTISEKKDEKTASPEKEKDSAESKEVVESEGSSKKKGSKKIDVPVEETVEEPAEDAAGDTAESNDASGNQDKEVAEAAEEKTQEPQVAPELQTKYQKLCKKAADLTAKQQFSVAATLYNQARQAAETEEDKVAAQFDEMKCLVKANKVPQAKAVAKELRSVRVLNRSQRTQLSVVEKMK